MQKAAVFLRMSYNTAMYFFVKKKRWAEKTITNPSETLLSPLRRTPSHPLCGKISCYQYFLDTQLRSAYTRPVNNQCPIKVS